MQLKKIIKILFRLLLVIVIRYFVHLYRTTPEIEYIKLRYEEVTIKVGQSIRIVEDVYPDPSFYRLKAKTDDDTVVMIEKGMFWVKGLKPGKTQVTYYDNDKEIGKVIITVK